MYIEKLKEMKKKYGTNHIFSEKDFFSELGIPKEKEVEFFEWHSDAMEAPDFDYWDAYSNPKIKFI